jgi:hypothetical protein
MANLVRIEGVSNLLRQFDRLEKSYAKGFRTGISMAGLLVQRESQLIVPVDTSNLKNSAFTRTFGSGFQSFTLVGYTAAYAVFVHEDLMVGHAPGKVAKFLTLPLRGNVDTIVQIVRREMLAA